MNLDLLFNSDSAYLNDHCYSYNSNVRNLKIACLNVCGLSCKTNFPDLSDFVSKYDIVGLVQTKLDSFDSVVCDGYRFYGVNRKQCKRKSGGVGIFVKTSLADHIVILDDNNENCLLFKFENILNSDIVFGVIYIPPENSPYSSIDIFDAIENNLVNYTQE